MPLLGGHSVTIPQFAGPILIGYFLNWALLGVLNVQVYLYHVTFTRDPIVMQCLVYGILLFEWVQTGLLTAGAFEVFVYRYGDVEALGLVYNGWFSLPIMCALVSMVVQWFFAWRIYMLSKLRILMGGIIILSLLQGICGIMVGAKFKTVSSTAVGIFADAYLPTVLIIWLVGSAVVDVVIAVTMTILVSEKIEGSRLTGGGTGTLTNIYWWKMVRRKTGIQQTDKMVNKLIRLIVETGTLTATIAIVGLSLIVAFPGILYYEPA
ncbi:uncharacterized protein B0H18DRAFT_1120246 [Fomitopsis serialis]|uniref:uncharacterized protein n=1 Tax=Fomitopsis serialis TaxID=139415 RepID=UPI002007AA1C|nr:uncharacterized protein B0H18DRAFT_1120246 [Neoantrodia serialis]KAH9923905.1 hypothetical protein B0H18DRAFT_1120246 [Neoantrodia serialis]